MPPHSQDLPTRRSRQLSEGVVPDEPSWAHVSGWNQLSGSLRTISCVVVSLDDRSALSSLLPTLSDTLTECGYPWEVIIVHAGADESVRSMLRGWGEIPGFWSVLLTPGASEAQALTVGLEASRGDAVIILSSHPPLLAHLVPQAILHWESGAQLVYATPDPIPRHTTLAWWDAATVDRMMASSEPMNLPPGSTDLALLDRRVIEFLLG